MISRLIRANASVPHEIIRAELAAPPLVVGATSSDNQLSEKPPLADIVDHKQMRQMIRGAAQNSTIPFSLRCSLQMIFMMRHTQHLHCVLCIISHSGVHLHSSLEDTFFSISCSFYMDFSDQGEIRLARGARHFKRIRLLQDTINCYSSTPKLFAVFFSTIYVSRVVIMVLKPFYQYLRFVSSFAFAGLFQSKGIFSPLSIVYVVLNYGESSVLDGP
ncbi:hypothetical protein L7F22_025573 [Adiantum nelumboides]|nr:hypothetical protein [Adiantum nelumboides]